MKNDDQTWVTDAHRKLAEAEKARYRWLVETSQWPYETKRKAAGDGVIARRTRLVLITVVIWLLIQVMWNRSTTESPVTDELLGITTQGL